MVPPLFQFWNLCRSLIVHQTTIQRVHTHTRRVRVIIWTDTIPECKRCRHESCSVHNIPITHRTLGVTPWSLYKLFTCLYTIFSYTIYICCRNYKTYRTGLRNLVILWKRVKSSTEANMSRANNWPEDWRDVLCKNRVLHEYYYDGTKYWMFLRLDPGI